MKIRSVYFWSVYFLELKAGFPIYTKAEGSGTLSKPMVGARSLARHGEGVVVGVGDVGSPEVEVEATNLEVDMCSKHGISLLAASVSLIPIVATLTSDVGTYGDAVEPTMSYIETPVGRSCKGMIRHERYRLALVVDSYELPTLLHTICIFAEGGMGEAIAGGIRQMIVEG